MAVRAPSHPVAQTLLRAIARPIAAPRPIAPGRVSPTEAAHVATELGDRVALILDDGRTQVGLESTVLDLSARLLCCYARAGSPSKIAEPPRSDRDCHYGRRPGALARHAGESLRTVIAVAPRRDRRSPRRGIACLRPHVPAGFVDVQWLSHAADLGEAAANLFTMLRRLDRPEFLGIAVMPIPNHGLGRAINDRLQRAAAPRR